MCFLGQFSIVGGDCVEQVIERGRSLDQALAQVVIKASNKVTRVHHFCLQPCKGIRWRRGRDGGWDGVNCHDLFVNGTDALVNNVFKLLDQRGC